MNDLIKAKVEKERDELIKLMGNLEMFLISEQFKELDPLQKTMLTIQQSAMATYLECLSQRLNTLK